MLLQGCGPQGRAKTLHEPCAGVTSAVGSMGLVVCLGYWRRREDIESRASRLVGQGPRSRCGAGGIGVQRGPVDAVQRAWYLLSGPNAVDVDGGTAYGTVSKGIHNRYEAAFVHNVAAGEAATIFAIKTHYQGVQADAAGSRTSRHTEQVYFLRII